MKDICNQEKFFSTSKTKENYYAQAIILSLASQGTLSLERYRENVRNMRLSEEN